MDTLVRKRSSYLLKRIIATTDAICKQSNSDYNSSLKYFHWSSKHAKELQKYWSTFFLVFETLEEFNLHLIKVNYIGCFNL